MRLYKIGISSNVTQRVITIKTGCPDVRVVCTYPYGRRLEEFLHARLAEVRFGDSEWFDLDEIGGKGCVDDLVRQYTERYKPSSARATQ